jgi:hypothetical protein
MMSCRFSSKSCFPNGSLDFAAIAIGALVPAAIMSIGAATLFTHHRAVERADRADSRPHAGNPAACRL